MQRESLSAAELYDAAVRPGREQLLEDEGLEVVARPGMAPPSGSHPGLIAVQRAHGEGRLTSLVAVERVAHSRAELEAEGIPCEGYSDGIFIEVESPSGGRRGLQVGSAEGVLRGNVVLLRELPEERSRPIDEEAWPTGSEASEISETPETNEAETSEASDASEAWHSGDVSISEMPEMTEGFEAGEASEDSEAWQSGEVSEAPESAESPETSEDFGASEASEGWEMWPSGEMFEASENGEATEQIWEGAEGWEVAEAADPMPFPEVPEDTDPSALATLLAAVCALHRQRARGLREEYLRSLLKPDSGTPPLDNEIQRALADLARRQAALPAGQDRAAALTAMNADVAAGLLAAAERTFILDVNRSTLELLEPAERDRYLGFAWHANDFPGGPEGPNETRAERMFTALTRLRPERRANLGATAAVRKDEFDAAMQRRIQDALVPVPGERGQRLHRDASAAFVEMRTAAAAEGVTLVINNSYRTAAHAQANAARAANRAAVASFSSHTLGFAVDLNLSHGSLRLTEISTRPFQNLVNMYKSPVHKWMFLRGETYGWYPYQREPWHWEYNPSGFRERLRQPASTPSTAPSTAPSAATGSAPSARPGVAPSAGAGAAPSAVPKESTDAGEAVNDPVRPPRAPLAITGTVGRGGRNNAADVTAVQARLVELHVVDAATLAPERPAGTAAVPETSLARTIEAIETFQGQVGVTVNGSVALTGPTRTELDRAIPVPSPSEFATIGTELQTINQTVSRGLTLSGPVGATTTGNAIEDVRAVQRRLVDLGVLPASHGEAPAAGAAGTVPQARLSATIAALRRFQDKDVQFFLSRGTVTGRVTRGVVSPGDATAALLDRISMYNMALGSTRLSFRDHVVSGATESETGVSYSGTASPSALAVRSFQDLGLSAGEAAALKLVSTFEGNFDAINTYDRAIVSAGFIQFAGGGRGLTPYIGLFKARQPAKFRDLLQKFGIDVEFTVAGNAVTGAQMVVLDPAATRVVRGTAAETAIRGDKRLTTALILSGRDGDVKLVQVEAAIRGYVRPAQNLTVAPSTRGGTVRLGDILRSQKGMAALFDRAIQEGIGGAKRRFERVIQRLVRNAEPHPLPTPPPRPPTAAQLQSREGDILAELERDLQAATDVGANITRALSSLKTVIDAARAAGATAAGLLARPELATARQAVTAGRVALPEVVNVSTSGSVDTRLAAINATLTAEERRLALTPPPSSVADVSAALSASRRALGGIAGSFSTAPMFLARIQRIRRSTLDAGLAEAA